MKNTLQIYFIFISLILLISCEKDEEEALNKSSSDRINKNFSNKTSKKATEVIDFQKYVNKNAQKDNFTHLLYGNTYVLENESGTSYSTGIVPLEKEFYNGRKSYYENLVVIEDNQANANGFIVRYDIDTDEPIGWEPVFGYILSNPCLPMATSNEVPCNCSGSHTCDEISQCCCGEPGCESGHQPLCGSGGSSIPCAKLYTEDGSVGVVGGGGGGGGGGGAPSPENNPIHMPSGESYPSGMVVVPFTQVPEVKVIDEFTEMKIATIVTLINADETVKDWLIDNNQRSNILAIIDNLFDMVLSPFITPELNDILLELLIYLTEDNTSLKSENTLTIIEFLEENRENGQIPLAVMEKIQEFLEITEEIPEARFDRFNELNDILEQNPWALIQDCAEQNGMDTSNYIDLYNHTIPQACQGRLDNLGTGYSNQPISEGNVPLANIDYYGVEITNYPDFDNDGNPDSEDEIYQAFREKFTDLASGEKDDFQFSCDIATDSDNIGNISWEFLPYDNYDLNLWGSQQNPVTAIIGIDGGSNELDFDLASDDGAIMISQFNSNSWIGSTITTPISGTQPFSGNRQWGWNINQNGNLELYTRAVDVANINALFNILPGVDTECQQDTYYNIAGATWTNMQNEIKEWIENEGGGQASVNEPKAILVKRETVEEILTTNESIDQILSNCN